jgi:hypothetical protein
MSLHPKAIAWFEKNWPEGLERARAAHRDDVRCPRCGSAAIRPPINRLQNIARCLDCYDKDGRISSERCDFVVKADGLPMSRRRE